MTLEDQHTDRKSLRAIIGRTVDWDEVARALVCFPNSGDAPILIAERGNP